MQDLSIAYQWVRARVSERRWAHTQCVVDAALGLASAHGLGLPRDRIQLAAVLHDCAKDQPLAAQLNLFGESGILLTDSDLLCPQVLHGPAGAVWVRRELAVNDASVLRAIAWHTTAAPGMGDLEKLIFLADFVSEDRKFPEAEYIRRLAYRALEPAVIEVTEQILKHLLENGDFIHPRLLWARNELKARRQQICMRQNRKGRRTRHD